MSLSAVLVVLSGHTNTIISLSFSRAALVSAAMDRTIRIWNPSIGALIHTISVPYILRSVSVARSSPLIVAHFGDSVIRTYNAETGEQVDDIESSFGSSIAATNDGKLLITGSEGGMLRHWVVDDLGLTEQSAFSAIKVSCAACTIVILISYEWISSKIWTSWPSRQMATGLLRPPNGVPYSSGA